MSPCRETTSEFNDQWDINSLCLPQVLARKNLFGEWALTFSDFIYKEKDAVEFPWLNSPQLLSGTISCAC